MTTPQATARTPWRSHRTHVIMAIASLAASMLTLTGCTPKPLPATYTVINNTDQELYVIGVGLNYYASIPAHSQATVNAQPQPDTTCRHPVAIDTTWTYVQEGPKICDGDTWTITTPPTEPAPYDLTHEIRSDNRPKVCNITTGCPTPTSTRPPGTVRKAA